MLHMYIADVNNKKQDDKFIPNIQHRIYIRHRIEGEREREREIDIDVKNCEWKY